MDKKSLDSVVLAVKSGQDIIMEVDSYSMLPTLSPGDKIIVRFVPVSLLKRGDIIVYKKNILIVHRLVKKIFHLLFTKGDNSGKIDKPFSNNGYVGKVVCIIKK